MYNRKRWAKPKKVGKLRPKEITTEQQSKQADTYNTTKWKKIRTRMLRENPLCEECLGFGRETPATDVHHIKPIEDFPDLRFTMSNLMCVCQTCHGKLEAQYHKDKKIHEQAERNKKKKMRDMDNDELREYRKIQRLEKDSFLTVTMDGKTFEIF